MHGYFVEVSYNVTHMSMRGLLGWDFRPLPDGRYDGVTEIATDSQKMDEFITETEIVKPEDIGLSFTEPSKRLHLRARKKADGTLFALIINEDLEQAAGARLSLTGSSKFQVIDVLTGQNRGFTDSNRQRSVQAQPGGAVVLRFAP